jgi:hypothetical protein
MELLSDDCTLWQSIFPGILADILKCLGSGRHRRAATGVEATCLQCMGQLLVVTLKPIPKEQSQSVPSTSVSSAAALLQKIQLQATTLSRKSNHSPTAPPCATKPNFLSLVQEKAAIPLSRTLEQWVTSKSISVQLQVLQLCRVILVDTAPCWTGTSLSLVALECCLILQNDANEEGMSKTKKKMTRIFAFAIWNRLFLLFSKSCDVVFVAGSLVQRLSRKRQSRSCLVINNKLAPKTAWQF